jgi:hypothetical protein
LARLTTDVAVAYDAGLAQFVSKYTKDFDFVPFNFGSTAGLLQKADMTVVANAFDCGECHVGGAGMQYMMNKPGVDRVSLRDIETSAAGTQNVAGKFTAFNYFIDQYNVDGDSEKFEAQHTNWAHTGVVEMDCFMCHLQGYKYKDRKDALRMVKFDATIPIGAGLATSKGIAWDALNNRSTPGYGTAVVYDPSKLVAVKSGDTITGYKLASSVYNNIKGTPPTANCSTCHFDTHAVDWKKRGDSLEGDVHANLGCMACHERTDKSVASVGTSGDFEPAYPGSTRSTAVAASADRSKLGLCDPAKGGASPYDGLANQLDNVNFKKCDGCHSPGPKTFQTFGAKNPDSAHKAKGVSLPMVKNAAGATVSHMDIISCEACHVKKNQYVTGGSIVDGTGVDLEGRVADHEHNAVTSLPPDQHHLTNAAPMTNRVGYAWSLDNKLHPVNLHTSFFIRSKNDRTYDINNDGRIPGVDGLLQTHAAEATEWDHTQAIFSDGVSSAAELTAYFAKVNAKLEAMTGKPIAAEGSDLRLSFMTVPFKNSHNIARGFEAFGAGGCTDCHGANKGFYNGIYDLTGGYDMKWSSSQMSPMTKVNGDKEPTITHPTVTDKFRDVAIAVNTIGATGMRNPDRSEFIYPAAFREYNKAWSQELIGAAPGFYSGLLSSQGWLVKLEICADANLTGNACSTTIHRTKQVSTNVTDVAALLGNLGAGFTANANFEFTIAANDANTGIKITAKPGYKVRLHKLASGPEFGFPGQFIPKAVKNAAGKGPGGTDAANDNYVGRDQWVAYLNTLGGPGINPCLTVAPTAAISSIAGSTGIFVVNTPVTLAADTTSACSSGYTYSWSISDSVGRGVKTVVDGKDVYAGLKGTPAPTTFPKTGLWNVTLSVKNAAGVISKATKKVNIIPAPSEIVVTDDGETGMITTVNVDLSAIAGTYDRLYIIWGDGAKQWVTTTSASMDVPHTFKRYDMYKQGDGTYKYNMTVYLYNGSTKVGTQANFPIIVGD